MAIVSERVLGRVLRGRRAIVRIMVVMTRVMTAMWYIRVYLDLNIVFSLKLISYFEIIMSGVRSL